MAQTKPEAANTTALIDEQDDGLDELQLNQVTGGIVITKRTDASSPLLMLNCASGAHVTTTSS